MNPQVAGLDTSEIEDEASWEDRSKTDVGGMRLKRREVPRALVGVHTFDRFVAGAAPTGNFGQPNVSYFG